MNKPLVSRRFLFFVLGLKLATTPALAEEIAITTAPCTITNTQTQQPLVEGDIVGALAFKGCLKLTANSPHFGGFSGMAIEGNRLLAISDEGRLLRADIAWQNGQPSFTAASLTPLWGSAKQPPKSDYDAEALLPLGDGRYLIGFEHHHRLATYEIGDEITLRSTTTLPEELTRLWKPNEGAEALAALDDGRFFLYTASRDPANGNLLGLMGKSDVWEPTYLTSEEDYTPTELLAQPNGGWLMLERSYSALRGVRIRLRFFPKQPVRPDMASWKPTLLAAFDHHSGLDNMEAMAYYARGQENEELWMVSDDNFSPLQNTILLRFAFGRD